MTSEKKDEDGNEHIQTSKKHLLNICPVYAYQFILTILTLGTQYNLFQPMSIYILFTTPSRSLLHLCSKIAHHLLISLLFYYYFQWSCIITRNVHEAFHETEICVFILILNCNRFLSKFLNSKEKFSFHTCITSWMKAL